jgi:hypothetical protein
LSNKAAAAEDLKSTVIANAANPGGPNRKPAGALIGLPMILGMVEKSDYGIFSFNKKPAD